MNPTFSLEARMATCGICHGRGWYTTLDGEKVECDACDGTGQK